VDGSDGVVLIDEAWRERARALADFSRTESAVNRHRFCTYVAENGEAGCVRCMASCPSGAQPASAPLATGKHSEKVQRQQHRFYEGALQFDYGRCLDERTQLAGLYSEWMCGRCVSICAGDGRRRVAAVESFPDYVAGRA
jgi:hypothetical protein